METWNWILSTIFILDVLIDIDSKYAYRLLENEEMPYLETLPQDINIKIDDIKNKIKGNVDEKD